MNDTRVVLVGIEGGALHIAKRERGGWNAACYRRVPDKRVALLRQTRREWKRARQHEWLCQDCQNILARGREGFLRATGW